MEVSALSRALEAIVFVREQDVEAGEASVGTGDVTLELDLHFRGNIRGIDLLLEHTQLVANTDNFLEKGIDRNGLFLQPGFSRTQNDLAAAPFLRHYHGRPARFLP